MSTVVLFYFWFFRIVILYQEKMGRVWKTLF